MPTPTWGRGSCRGSCGSRPTPSGCCGTRSSGWDLSARAYHRVLKLALTLADLAGDDGVGPAHVAEAVQYRVLDRTEGR